MQEKTSSKEFFVHVLLFLCVAGLVGGYFFILSEVSKLKKSQAPEVATQNISYPSSACDAECRDQIAQELASKTLPIPSTGPTPTPQVIIKQGATAAPAQRTTYVPFGGSGSFSTTNTGWTDVTGAQAYIDLKNNYSTNAYVTWQASIRANNGGEVHARLFDSTHSIAVDNSEISTATTSSTLIQSGKLNLWSGNNLYKVQIYSLNSYNVTFDSGSIKIVY